MSHLRSVRRVAAAAGLCLVLLTGCYGLDPQVGSGSGDGVAEITAVRSANNGSFDRVVFEFGDGKLPDWDVRMATPPFTQDGSGATVAVSGHAFLAVRMTPADAHSSYGGPGRVHPAGTANVTEIVNTGDFEAVVNWVIGMRDVREFNVTVLDAPRRLVIDVKH